MPRPDGSDSRTTAQKNKATRQEALRAQLAEQCRVQHILGNIEKLEDLDTQMDSNEISRIKGANEQRIKLLGKYLPDLKATEITGEDGGPLTISKIVRTIVDAQHTNS
jgi:hypothetical protein